MNPAGVTLQSVRFTTRTDLFNPFSKNFMIRNTLSSLDSIFSHVIIACLTVIYIIDVSINYPLYGKS